MQGSGEGLVSYKPSSTSLCTTHEPIASVLSPRKCVRGEGTCMKASLKSGGKISHIPLGGRSDV